MKDDSKNNPLSHEDLWFIVYKKLKIKSVAYCSQESHTGQLDYCNWQAVGSTTG